MPITITPRVAMKMIPPKIHQKEINMFNYIKTFLASKGIFAPEAKGQGLVEYALLLILVVVVSIIILGTIGDQISAIFTDVSGQLP